MGDTDKVISTVATWFANQSEPPSEAQVRKIVESLASLDSKAYTSDEIEFVVATLQTRFTTRMTGFGSFFEDEEAFHPWWLGDSGKKWTTDTYYWNRYKKVLALRLPSEVARVLDETTDKILDHLEDPQKEGEWAKKGLVVGHVQSGKTANYIGLISKAVDSGYKVIIVLGGMLDALRNQTQARIDADFSGWCARTRKHIGVGCFDSARHPICFTNDKDDFKRQVATQVSLSLDKLPEPVVFVIKKNVATLEHLRDWLAGNNKHDLRAFPLLLIDDEADHASINTNKDDRDPTKINNGIRELLWMFPRSAFVGYTATPFANIFIDPESKDEMQNEELSKDLFPRHFILSLDPPTNYFGAETVFNDTGSFVRDIDGDNEDILPLNHKKDFEPLQLPESLKRAVDCFILAKTIRLLRGHSNKHHSMMVNASRFTAVQMRLKELLSDFLGERQSAIVNYAVLPTTEALRDSRIATLHSVWQTEYAGAGFAWDAVQRKLYEAARSIVVVAINRNKVDSLDYAEHPGGRSLIAVGGLSLSRGITLEGLCVSWFLRNTVMYDTLLQMGRWFGYRDGYADLCRVFMSSEAASNYAFIAEAVEELRADFKDMDRLRITPLEFGLKVRSHPAALIVTAKNKMRTAQTITHKIALAGHFVETYRLLNKPEILQKNEQVLLHAVEEAKKNGKGELHSLGYLWKGVPLQIVQNLVVSFRNAQDCMKCASGPLGNFLVWWKSSKGDTCDILLRSLKKEGKGGRITRSDLPIYPVSRKLENKTLDADRLTFTKGHIISKGDEAAGIPAAEVKRINDEYNANTGGSNVPDREYRKYKAEHSMPPLLILEFASVHSCTDESQQKIVPAYGISFPGNPSNGKTPEKLVEYTVNTTWMRLNADGLDAYSDSDYAEEDET